MSREAVIRSRGSSHPSARQQKKYQKLFSTGIPDPEAIPELPYKVPLQIQSEKEQDGTYPDTKLGFKLRDFSTRRENILKPLSLFAPYPHEDTPEREDIGLERPVTPINDEVKEGPRHYSQLAKYVRRRIAPDSKNEYLSQTEQQELAGVLIGEVNEIWPDIRRQVDDSFLTTEQNAELQRRIAVHIVTVCEQLFKHYLRKASILNARGVFSGPANMARLKAQLTLEAHKFLDVLTIRRYIISDIRGHLELEDKPPARPPSSKSTARSDGKKQMPSLSYKKFLMASRPKSADKEVDTRSSKELLQDLVSSLPTLDTSQLLSVLETLPNVREEEEIEERPESESTGSSLSSAAQERRVMEKAMLLTDKKAHMRRSSSMPNVNAGETLFEELGIEPNERVITPRDNVSKVFASYPDTKSKRRPKVSSYESEKPEVGSRAYLQEDLQNLTQVPSDKNPDDEEEDLPPLLQALNRSAKHDGRKEIIQQQLKSLEQKEQEYLAEMNQKPQPPTEPQPATVTRKIANKTTVRTSDIRVSERVCMSAVTIDRHPTVYNDLLDELDSASITALDQNLFMGEEIKEVYREIMNTVPLDHFNLDMREDTSYRSVNHDELVEPAADAVDISTALASHTLTQRRKKRVINSRLKHKNQPPWEGQGGRREWAKTPFDPPKDFYGNNTVQPMTPDLSRILGRPPGGVGAGQSVTDGADGGGQSYFMERMSRTYASWLMWWKDTITADDYMKYLSTQESDFMSHVFHFYDSEDEEDEDAPARRLRQRERERKEQERNERLEELKRQKTEFKAGFWNVNSIMLGGLGQDPLLEDDTEENTTALSSETPREARTLTSRVSQKQQSKATEASRTSSAQAQSKARMSRPATQATQEGTEMSAGDSRTAQERLEIVWQHLQMPDGQRLDCAIKYSSSEYFSQLEEAIDAWEHAANAILAREKLISQLENFERDASDPRRFFSKGSRGSSIARLDEARRRSAIYKKIEEADKVVKDELDYIRDNFQDILTFKGRPYYDKMQWDRIEMLHWLQEERKMSITEQELASRNMHLKVTTLDPVTATPISART